MKTKNVLLFIAVITTIITQAATITVSNNPNNPGLYSDLQTAVNAASANDILYVIGSGKTYGNVTISKKLTIIGAGALPDKSLPLNTIIGNITFGYDTTTTTNANGSSIYGCDISTIYFANAAPLTGSQQGISDIIISRNKIQNLYWSTHPNISGHKNYLIDNNVIYSFSGSYDYGGGARLGDAIIKNNIISYFNNIGSQGFGSWIFSNNVVTTYFYNNTSGVISNNILTLAHPTYFNNNTTCVFANNIFYSTVAFALDFLNGGTLTSSGNLINQDPGFVNATNVANLYGYTYTSPAAGPFINLNLSPTSAGKNYGTDGKDLGIYGGTTPFIEGSTVDSRFRYFPKPAIPQMLNMTVNNPQVSQNGTLNVSFSASKQD